MGLASPYCSRIHPEGDFVSAVQFSIHKLHIMGKYWYYINAYVRKSTLYRSTNPGIVVSLYMNVSTLPLNIRYASILLQLRGRSIGLLPLCALMLRNYLNGNDNKQYLDNISFWESEHTLMINVQASLKLDKTVLCHLAHKQVLLGLVACLQMPYTAGQQIRSFTIAILKTITLKVYNYTCFMMIVRTQLFMYTCRQDLFQNQTCLQTYCEVVGFYCQQCQFSYERNATCVNVLSSNQTAWTAVKEKIGTTNL